MPNLRFQVVGDAFKKHPLYVQSPKERPSEFFAKYVFNKAKMAKYLDKDTYSKMLDVIDNGSPLDRQTADKVADGMKQWAMELGVTHCTHWFQPLTNTTAEKHDAFVEHDGMGGMIEEFSGKSLVQQEPDASSFPSGGIRSTFEARGYSAWDPTSPVFVVGDTLMIPTVFISYTGEALDYKTPLLKGLQAINKAATAVAQYFNPEVKKVITNLGWEQEYFLIDEGLYSARPDLLLTGRTLMGHSSAKDQQMDDHYFGAIPERVAEFMKDLEIQALELGIPCKTRHNEVAPNQFELAPIYEECNLAVDHNMLIMSLMQKVARKHGFRCLLHEKPFDGINGSGKHNNWSLATDTGILLHGPGKDDLGNLRFITFVVETLMGVYKHNGLMKASIMSATNAHRLGELLIDNTDRNRTSPFAFTGNRFEFRAPGSEANCAAAMITLNAAVAEALVNFKERVDALIASGKEKTSAIIEILRQDIKTCKPIRFDGNGYSDEWKEEAKRRGLDVEKSCPLIFDRYTDPETIQMFESLNIMNRKELAARNDIKWETYTKKVQIEARIFGDLSINHIIPQVVGYQTKLAENVAALKAVLSEEQFQTVAQSNLSLINEFSCRIKAIEEGCEALTNARRVANKITSIREKAIAYHDTVEPLMEQVRYHIDKLEEKVDDEVWTLPKYREMLFMR